MTGIIAVLSYFTKDDRFKPVYAGWLGAAIVAFPALLLRFLGPNNDQLGSIAQIVICLIAFAVVVLIRKVKLDWRVGNVFFFLILAAFCVAPVVIFGAVCSSTDAILRLLAGVLLWFFALGVVGNTTPE